MKKVILFGVVSLLLPVWTQNVVAHDMWLAPEQFTLSKGDTLIVHQVSGDELEAEQELELDLGLVKRFTLTTVNGSMNLMPTVTDWQKPPRRLPVLKRKIDVEGLALLAMEYGFFYDEFPTKKFIEHLRHEDLDLEEFKDRLGQKPMQGERYARSLKSLLKAGKTDVDNTLYKQVIGQKIEIVLLQNPYRLNPGDALEVQVLFEGKPLPGQRVVALNREEIIYPTTSVAAKTNAQGLTKFTLLRPGTWLIRLVYLRECTEKEEGECLGFEWESYWASYSFELD